MRENRKQHENFGLKRKLSIIFGKLTWIGLILIIASIIIDAYFEENIISHIFIQLLCTIGIALLIGAIFDFSKNSQAFIELVSKLLSEIIVSKSFLSRMERSDKKNALALILQPTENQIEQYSNINEYFKKKLDSNMHLFETNFKTNFVINVEARIDTEKNLVYTQGTISYRIYKIQNKYQPIVTQFYDANSTVTNTRIIYPGNICIPTPPDPQYDDKSGVKTYSFEIPKELYDYPFLTIERDIYEPGFSHWMHFDYKALTPYDGIVVELKCFDGLSIQDVLMYIEKNSYTLKISEDKTSLRLLSTDWLDANTGFSIIVSNS